jgi:hypothetical protein
MWTSDSRHGTYSLLDRAGPGTWAEAKSEVDALIRISIEV